MDAEDEGLAIAYAIRCAGCRRPWKDGREPWRTYLTSDEPPELVTYCPECAAREFGE
jgi:hypothetical protein